MIDKFNIGDKAKCYTDKRLSEIKAVSSSVDDFFDHQETYRKSIERAFFSGAVEAMLAITEPNKPGDTASI